MSTQTQGRLVPSTLHISDDLDDELLDALERSAFGGRQAGQRRELRAQTDVLTAFG
jgi:hypothetical protein